jgi:hypothetical protein
MAAVVANLTSVLETIKDMEVRLAALRELVGGAAVSGGKKRRVKRERDPNAPKREANVWIKFTQVVDRALKEGGVAFKRVADSKKFAKHLKSKRTYEEWDAASILEERKSWESWTTVEEQIAPAAAEAPVAAEAAATATEGITSEEKKRGRKPMTEEQKAAAKLAREAKKAAEAANPTQ